MNIDDKEMHDAGLEWLRKKVYENYDLSEFTEKERKKDDA